MFRLRLFGGFALEAPSEREVPPRLRPRAKAVLAVLALCGNLGCSRARVLALLWPESDEAKARHNLRDTLHAIRTTLGRDAVINRGDSLLLDPTLVTSDVQDFAGAWGAGRLSEAAALYHGPLLDGFHLGGAPEFERWVEDERTRLLTECLEGMKRLAKRAENEGRWDAAAERWGRVLALDRYNSRVVVRRMVALARGGDRANAIKEGEAHCELLKSDLELDPDASFLEELQRIRRGEVGPVRFFTPGTVPSRKGGPLPPESEE
ncbi:BTAD domain-containing putative transcriptional regulator [Gemmatimonadota bacterium]